MNPHVDAAISVNTRPFGERFWGCSFEFKMRCSFGLKMRCSFENMHLGKKKILFE